MARLERVASVETPTPQSELRVRRDGPVDAEYEIWQMPAAATPHVTAPLRVAGLRDRNLHLVDHHVLKRLARAGIKLGSAAGRMRRGYALTEDLAWRMAVGNPHLDDPLFSEATVLIDEVELHRHPSWQQRVLTDLRRTFPNTQFIVSTNSPHVLTTVEPEYILKLAREDGRIVAGSVAAWTYGAEAGDVLSAVMMADERPVNDSTETLARYRRLVSEARGESEEAVALRATVERLSPEDSALVRADLEIGQRTLFKEWRNPDEVCRDIEPSGAKLGPIPGPC